MAPGQHAPPLPDLSAMADLFSDFVVDFFRFGNDLWIVVDFVDGG